MEETSPEVLVLPGLLDPALSRQLLGHGFNLSLNGELNGEISPGIQRLVNGEGGFIEQALLIKGQRGWSMLFGCAHGGVDHWVQKATSLIEGPIDLVMGGFHLFGAQPTKVRGIIDQFSQAWGPTGGPLPLYRPGGYKGTLKRLLGRTVFNSR